MSVTYSKTAVLLAFAAVAAAGAAEQPSTLRLGADRFARARTVLLAQPTTGDAILMGGDIRLQAPVSGDVLAAGRAIRLGGTMQQDVYAAGAEVTVAGIVRHNARLAGGAVTLTPSGSVEGNVSVVGGELHVAGTIGGYLQAAGDRIYINGPVRGDVRLSGGAISLGPEADIAGVLRYRSEHDIRRDPATRVAGGVERLAARDERQGAATLAWTAVIWLLGFAIVAAVLITVLPTFTQHSSRTAMTRWGQSLLIGLGAMVFAPLLIVAGLISIVGIPLAVALLLLYLLMLLLGFAAAGIAIGDAVLQNAPAAKRAKTAWRTLAAAVGVAILLLLAWIPVVGWIVALIGTLMGVGAMLTQLRTRNASMEPSPVQ